MSSYARALVVGALVSLGAIPALAHGWSYDEGLAFKSKNFRLHVDNRVQVRFTLEDLDDDEGPGPVSAKGSFDIARYKLRLSGGLYEDWNFRVQAELAGGSESSSNLLEDAYFEFTRRNLAQLRVGQSKVAFGRQAMTPSGNLQFVDRSIATERFSHGRDVGLTLFGHNRENTYAYSVGVYNGNGINKDEGDNVDYMGLARLVVTPFGARRPELSEFDRLYETDTDRSPAPYLAIGVSAFTNTIGTENVEETRVTRGALEIAYKIGGWNVVAEFFTESEDTLLLDAPTEPDPDEEDTDGWYLQGGYLFEKGYEIAARYSEILPDDPNTDATELGLAFGYYLRPSRNHTYKLQADYRRLEFETLTVPESEETIDRDVIRVQFQLVF